MPAEPDRAAAGRWVDAPALQHIQRRLQLAAQAPWLHGEAGRRMAERLAVIRLQPQQVLDWWSFNGASAAALQQAYPKARLQPVEPDGSPRSAAAAAAAPWWSARHWRGIAALVRAACTESQVSPGLAELVWANMALHHGADPEAFFLRWHRALKVDGFLMFSTFGPGTLVELQSAYADAGWPAPFAPFVDMHDLGDMLVQAGFADPVMDQETVTLTWPSAEAALQELRGLGGNAHPRRTQGLRSPRWRQHLLALIDARCSRDGRVALSFELVYGHAFKSAPRAAVAAQTKIAVDDFKSMLRARKSSE